MNNSLILHWSGHSLLSRHLRFLIHGPKTEVPGVSRYLLFPVLNVCYVILPLVSVFINYKILQSPPL